MLKYRLLGNYITLKRGHDLPHAQRIVGHVPIVSSSGITGFHNVAKVEPPGVVTGRYGTLGEVFYIDKSYWPLNTSLYVQDFKGNHPRFIAYYLQTILRASMNSAGAVPGVNRNVLHKIKVAPLPLYKEQQKIAAILTAYDDLIENNRQRIALLEQMAEEIYREWFVRLRFLHIPGHKHTPVHKGVPDGWTEEPIEDAFEFTGGGTPSKNDSQLWTDGEVNWYTPSDITGTASIFHFSSNDKCNEEGVRRSSARMFPAYSIMLTSRATIGAIGINTTPACTNQGFITCIPNERYPLTLLYHWLKLATPHFEMLSSGATFMELTKGTFKKITVLRPSDALVNEFERIGRENFRLVETLQRENLELTETRNLLRNRLISGKLRVDNLDIQFPPSMQAASA